MKSEIQNHAEFSNVRYAQCWEDADILCEALKTHEGRRCISIGSAGDNSFALLATGASHVTVVEMNPAQIACIELRRAAYMYLNYDEFKKLLGIETHQDRWALFEKCQHELSAGSKRYWQHQRNVLEAGVIHGGKFENYFRLFREKALRFAHPRQRVADLLVNKSKEKRGKFYEQSWNNYRWRMIFKIFFSRFVMGRLGRDPAFFQYVEGSVADRILARTKHALVELNPSENSYLQFILNGQYTDVLPLALRPAFFEKIKASLFLNDSFRIIQAPLEDALTRIKNERFHAFNLSDIFEYMNEANTETLLRRIHDVSVSGARLAYWNMLAPRSRPETMHHLLKSIDDEAQKLFSKDKAFFYSRFVIEEVI